MDRIIENQLISFCQKYGISENESLSVRFEHFVNYIYFLNNVPSAYGTERDVYKKVHTGRGGDWGIDGILIVINGQPVFSETEAKSIIEKLNEKPLSVEFYFTQAKTSDNFDIGDMLKTREGILKFFGNNKPDNEHILRFWEIQDLVFANSMKFEQNPICHIGFVTTGKWEGNTDQIQFIEKAYAALESTNLFSDVKWEPIDAKKVQNYFKNINSSITKQVKFEKKTPYPSIPNVSQSHVGLIEGSDFIDLITFEGNLNKSIFYENVRAYLGDNYVNKEIAQTINDAELRKLFPILNNGVTIVARSLNLVGDYLTLKDFQIVNGCQTSNVLYNNREHVSGIMVPVKIISSDNQDVINRIIRSTNRQTTVTSEAFESIKDIHKNIQDFYNTFNGRDRIYYERRSREYDKNNNGTIKNSQVFTIPMQLMCHVAMFLDEPHLAEREYYGKLLSMHEKTIFQKEDLPIVYYCSARSLFKIETLIHSLPFEDRKIVKNYRFHLLMIVRYLVQGKSDLPRMNSRAMDKMCQKIITYLEDEKLFNTLMRKAIDILIECCKRTGNQKSIDLEKLTRQILEYDFASKSIITDK